MESSFNRLLNVSKIDYDQDLFSAKPFPDPNITMELTECRCKILIEKLHFVNIGICRHSSQIERNTYYIHTYINLM